MPLACAGVDHAGDRVVPEVLLVDRAVALDVAVDRVLAHEVAGVAAADAGGLHATVGGEVGGAERQALHAGRRRADLLDVGDAAGRLEDRVHEDRPVEPGLRLELGEEAVDVVDVLGPLDLRDHDHVELVADLGDRGDRGRRGPTASRASSPGSRTACRRSRRSCRPRRSPARAASLSLAGTPSSRLARRTSTVGARSGSFADHLRVRRREEVDHPRRPERDLADRVGGADGQRAEEVLGGAHAPP